ncbi:MAG: class I SAM-dependent methyltransferase [Rhodospirillales bacterium]|nr:class I SAM-dependent methyltransferase [Rhodospirillales bacterium]
MEVVYNNIGVDYAKLRKPDPRLIELICAQIIDLNTILNVGAGAGSYEPDDKNLIALEPSWRMISQRPAHAAPSVCGIAESLPFQDNSFDGGLALLTLHHWSDIDRGLNELKRVVTKRLVIHTWDSTATENYWLINDYIPELLALDAGRFPKMDDLIAKFRSARIIEVPIPCDCTDGFQGAYWQRPEAYLDDHVKKGISSFQQISQKALSRGLARLRADLDSGIWHNRYAGLLDKEAIDLGYRLIVAKAE